MSETLQLGGIVCMECLDKLEPLGHDGFNEAVRRGEFGYHYTIQPPTILEDGTVIYVEKCTRCDYHREMKEQPRRHQRCKRIYEITETGETYEKREDVPLHTWCRTKYVPIGEPFLVDVTHSKTAKL